MKLFDAKYTEIFSPEEIEDKIEPIEAMIEREPTLSPETVAEIERRHQEDILEWQRRQAVPEDYEEITLSKKGCCIIL